MRVSTRHADSILRSCENPKSGCRVDPDSSGLSGVRSFRVLTWTEYTAPTWSVFAGGHVAGHRKRVARRYCSLPPRLAVARGERRADPMWFAPPRTIPLRAF